MEKKRSIIEIVLAIAFVCFGLLILFNFIRLVTTYGYLLPHLYRPIIAIIYIVIGLVIFNKWVTLKYWQKGAFVGMLVRLILVGLLTSYYTLMVEKNMPNWEFQIANFVNIISSPFQKLHSKLIAFPRAVESVDNIAIYIKSSEMAICTFLDMLYACIVGIIIAVLIEKRKSSPAPK